MKKILGTAIVTAFALFLLPDTAQAATKVSGNFHYKVLNQKEKTAAVIYVDKVGSKLVIPKKIKGYKVVQVGSDTRKAYTSYMRFKDAFKEYHNKKCDCNINEDSIAPGRYEHNCTNRILSKESAKKLKKVVLPDTVTAIGINAFVDCQSLKQVTMPKNLRYIHAMAFKNTALSTVVLPKKLKGVGYDAFAYCVKLKKLVVKSDTLKIGEAAFENPGEVRTGKLKKLQLPSPFKGSLMEGSLSGYMGTSFTWPEFKKGEANVGFFEGGASKLKTIKFAKGAKTLFIGERTLPSGVKKITVPANARKITLEQQQASLETLTIKGKKTVLVGEAGMGTYPYKEKRKYISVRKIIAPKASKAWKFAEKAYYPDTFNFVPAVPEEWNEWAAERGNYYEEKYIDMKKVQRQKL